MKRREFSKKLLTAVASYSLIHSAFGSYAFSKKISPILSHWSTRLNEYSLDLKHGEISPSEWQTFVEELYEKVSIEEVLKFIDFDQLIKGFEYPDLGVKTKPVKFPKLTQLPEDTTFVKKIFGMKKDRAIIPHGHSNMVSAHLVLKGEMHLRNYEKIAQEKEFLIIKPTVDKIISIGESSSISDEKDNIHWFIANSETAFTFDVIMLDLKDKPYDIHNIDIYEGEKLTDNKLRVPILDIDNALKKYGKHHH